ncbi:acetyl-CoA synthetase-like protein, partial [Colletotrichum zoysiae]
MQRLWSRVMTVEESAIGATDNFFQLGGDSISAMRLVAACQEEGLALTVSDIFERPQLRDVARSVTIIDDPNQCHNDEENDPPFSLYPWQESTETPAEATKWIASLCGVSPDRIQDIYPCTPLQEGLMAITMRKTGAYTNRMVYKLPESIDLDRFVAAWSQVATAHPILRTRIVVDTRATGGADTKLYQAVIDKPIDWQRPSSTTEYVSADESHPFSYGDPLSRFALVSEGKGGSNHFVWTVHHAVYDGWTLKLVLDDLASAYRGSEPSRAVPFKRFIRHLITNSETTATDSFWTSQLEGQTPSSFPRLPSATYQPRARQQLRHHLWSFDTKGLMELATPLPTILRAVWGLVVAAHTGFEDIIFAMTLSGRNAPVNGIDKIAAPLMTTVPVRMSLDSQQTMRSYLAAIYQQDVALIPFQHTGLQNIQEIMRRHGMMDRLDMNHLFVVQPELQLDQEEQSFGMEAQKAPALVDFGSYALVIECNTKTNSEIAVNFTYDDALLSPTEINILFERFQFLLSSVLAAVHEETKISHLLAATPTDVRRILSWTNALPATEPINSCIHHIFQDQALLRPEAVALRSWDADLTYKQLDQFSTTLASDLQEMGVKPEVNVPLHFEKSTWAIVAQLAVLKAGGTCVPLNPAWPKARNDAIITQTRASVILVYSDTNGDTAFSESDQFVTMTVGEALFEQRQERKTTREDRTMVSQAISNNAAFIIYTSGTTGTAKGVVLEHKSLVTTAAAHGAAYGIGPTTRVGQFAAYTFDASVSEIFTTLQRGGTVCTMSEHDRANDLSAALRDMRVNFLAVTDTVASLLDPANLPLVQTLVLVGERPSDVVVARWQQHCGTIMNGYGPTECSIAATCNPKLAVGQTNNIGCILSGAIWLVNPQDHNLLQPTGSIGEMLIEGPLVARGYLDDHLKTAAAFIEDPDWVRLHNLPTGKRLYKTGDLARYDTDGSLIYLGRKDNQVKIRGQRVELSEIEQCLTKVLPQSRVASSGVAVELATVSDRPVLAAFMAQLVEAEPSEGGHEGGDAEHQKDHDNGLVLPLSGCVRDRLLDVQSSLGDVLPRYMIPSVFIPVRTLPSNVSGKLDRTALRQALSRLSAEELASYSLVGATKQAPSTDLERQLQGLWARVLSISPNQIGASDSFFQVGGDSVSAMRLVAMCREEQL